MYAYVTMGKDLLQDSRGFYLWGGGGRGSFTNGRAVLKVSLSPSPYLPPLILSPSMKRVKKRLLEIMESCKYQALMITLVTKTNKERVSFTLHP